MMVAGLFEGGLELLCPGVMEVGGPFGDGGDFFPELGTGLAVPEVDLLIVTAFDGVACTDAAVGDLAEDGEGCFMPMSVWKYSLRMEL